MTSSAQLERKAERARERLSNKIADLRNQVSPSTVVGDVFGVDPRVLENGVLPLVAKEVRNNPIASLLIGAGIGWLIFSEMRGPLSKMMFGPTVRRQIKHGRTKKRRTNNRKTAAQLRSR